MAPPESIPKMADPLDHASAFTTLIASLDPPHPQLATSKFVKKLDGIQEVSLPPAIPQMEALSLAEKGLVGQFTGVWPSPNTIKKWVERNWLDKTQGKISIRLCGRGFFTFHFETKEDKDLKFQNGPYFRDTRGLYLNKWTLDFDLELDVPNVFTVWVWLPRLPLHC